MNVAMQPALLLNTLSAALALALASTGAAAESPEELSSKPRTNSE